MTYNIGQINSALMMMPDRVLSHCIQDAMDKGNVHGSTVSLNIGICDNRETYVTVDADSLSLKVRTRMVRAEPDCAEWFHQYDPYLFNFIMDEHYPVGHLNFTIPVDGLLNQVKLRCAVDLGKMEIIAFIAEHHPEHIPTVRTLLKKSMSPNPNEYVYIMKDIWDMEEDNKVLLELMDKVIWPCDTICVFKKLYDDMIDAATFTKMIEKSLDRRWTKANYNTIAEEYTDMCKRVYKKMILKRGIPA